MRGKTRRKASLRLVAKDLGLVLDAAIASAAEWACGLTPVTATQRYLDAVCLWLPDVREKRQHFRTRLETMLGESWRRAPSLTTVPSAIQIKASWAS